MKTTRHGKRSSGMTLVEVMIAVVLFGICIAGIAGVVVVAQQTNDRARSHYIAVNIAKNRLERGRTFGFDQLSLLAEDKTVVDTNGNPDNDGNYRRTTTLAAVKPNLIEVTVEVEIRNRKTLGFEGENETVKSYYADYVERPD
ncbi:MAG: prepilin-type N-terminal cleavage/methylation domain-containing protein [Kiritimatiellia bacterium]